MLALNLMNVQHEYVVCRLLCFTLQGKASSIFFSLAPSSITSWKQFETAFITQFGDDKTSGTLFLELSRIGSIRRKMLRISIKDLSLSLIESLINHWRRFKLSFILPPLVAMFVKRKQIQTLEENFVEAIEVEKDLVAISNHLGNEESESSTSEKNGKKNEIESDGKDRVILQLQNENMNLKKNKG